MGMHCQEKLLIGLSTFIALVGLLVEFFWESSDGFSRSGPVIVCVGIWFGYRYLKRAIVRIYEERVNHLESKRLENDIVWHEEQLNKKERGTTDYALQQEEDTKGEDLKRAMKIDAVILTAGTLIWGFGDLLLPPGM